MVQRENNSIKRYALTFSNIRLDLDLDDVQLLVYFWPIYKRR